MLTKECRIVWQASASRTALDGGPVKNALISNKGPGPEQRIGAAILLLTLLAGSGCALTSAKRPYGQQPPHAVSSVSLCAKIWVDRSVRGRVVHVTAEQTTQHFHVVLMNTGTTCLRIPDPSKSWDGYHGLSFEGRAPDGLVQRFTRYYAGAWHDRGVGPPEYVCLSPGESLPVNVYFCDQRWYGLPYGRDMGHANAVREAERDGRATGNHQTGFSEMWQLRALFRAGVPETPKEEPRGIDWEADQAALEKRTQTPGSDAPKWWSGSVSTPWEEVILTGCRGRDPNL